MNRRVLLVNWRDIRNPEAGGAETYYHEIFKRLARSGYSVTVLSHRFPGSATTEDTEGVRVIRHGSRNLFNYGAMSYIRQHQSEYDLIIEDLNKLPFLTPLYVRKPRLHLAMHFFGAAIFKEVSLPMAAYVYAGEKLVSLLYRSEPFIAISESTRAEIARFSGDAGQVAVIEPGIDTDFFHPVIPKDPSPVLFSCGRIKRYKNVQFLLSALPDLRRCIPGIRLFVAGTGDYLPRLRALCARLGVEESVRFLGRITEEQKREMYSRATVFVNPSMKEGWGITNIEANLCGTVSISSDVPGLRDSVRNGVTGLLYRPDDQADYIEKVIRVISESRRRQNMEKAAREFALAYSWDRMARRMDEAITRLVPLVSGQ